MDPFVAKKRLSAPWDEIGMYENIAVFSAFSVC